MCCGVHRCVCVLLFACKLTTSAQRPPTASATDHGVRAMALHVVVSVSLQLRAEAATNIQAALRGSMERRQLGGPQPCTCLPSLYSLLYYNNEYAQW